jgi:hypothetical protein
MADMGGGVVGTRMGSFVPFATGRGGKRGVKPVMLRGKELYSIDKWQIHTRIEHAFLYIFLKVISYIHELFMWVMRNVVEAALPTDEEWVHGEDPVTLATKPIRWSHLRFIIS